MENQPLIITERHPDQGELVSQVIQKAVTAWLKKELRA